MPTPENPTNNQQPQQPQNPETPQTQDQNNNESQNNSWLTFKKVENNYVPENDAASLIPFSLGLDNLSVSNPGQGGTSPIGEAAVGELSGYWVTDPSLKQVGMVMTVFQSFPVKVNGEDKPYTMVVDQTSTIDGAGTNKGELCIGVLGCPDGYDVSLLDKVASNTKGGGFKVGASFWNERGAEYLQHYYPEVGFTVDHVNKMRRACILNAEVVIPTNGTAGKSFKIKMVDEGPRPPYAYVKGGNNAGLWKLDIIGAFCMLTDNQSLFEIVGKRGGESVKIDNTTYEFPYKDAHYDILTGEIPGYTPEALKEIASGGQVNANKAMVSKYFGHPIGGEVACRVKFYVESAHKAQAEEIVGKQLPEEFFTTNGKYGTFGVGSFAAGDGSVGAAIRQAATMVGYYCNTNRINYGAIGGYVKKPDGLVIGKGRNIDCASGINCILATAGIFTFSPGEYYGNTAWWRSGGHLSKLAPGYTATKVFAGSAIPADLLAPGDIILYDRGRDTNNHLSLYIGPGERADFGNSKSASSLQPLASSVRMTLGANDKQIVVWRITSSAAPAASTTPAV